MATATPATTLNTAIAGLRPVTMDRLLISEPDPALQMVLSRLFLAEGYEVDIVSEGVAGLELIRKRPPSALIVDLRHPISFAGDLCRKVLLAAPGMPFMILSAHSDVVDKVVLLEMGADDYITIPFNSRELVARLRALIRRATHGTSGRFYVFADVRLDFSKMNVTRSGERVLLTAKEFKTLEFMTKNPHRVISRHELLNEVWGYQNYPCTRTVDNHILRLRQKLENDPSHPSHFLTAHRVGYRFVP